MSEPTNTPPAASRPRLRAAFGRAILGWLAHWSTDALYAYQDADFASIIYDAHEALDKLGAPGPHDLGLVERIEATHVR